ncbi:MAG TPA: ABC transporter permease, partial [Bacteroidia bacterium]|nr:ABC transporter permease [Bacteroidia bacterium]
MPKNMTWLLFLDELKGFAKSSVMLAMWVGMPLMGIGLYYLLPSGLPVNTFTDDKFVIPASAFLSVMLSSIAGLLAATLVSIEIVNEKNKKIYDLFLIRPINRGSFMWAKFFAVSFCVSVAMVFALCGGLLLDVARGIPLSPMVLESILDSTLAAIGVILVSTAAGILIGMISKTVIIAVMLVWFVGQYVMLIPMLAALIPVEWVQGVTYGLTLIFTVIMVTAASMIFKRMEV